MDLALVNAPAHNALSVKRYLAARGIAGFEYALYSPDLAPCDFFWFESMEKVERKSGDLLKMVLQKKNFSFALINGKNELSGVCEGRGVHWREHSIVEWFLK